MQQEEAMLVTVAAGELGVDVTVIYEGFNIYGYPQLTSKIVDGQWELFIPRKTVDEMKRYLGINKP